MRQYHGWIYVEKEPGFKDYFYVQWKDEKGVTRKKDFGNGRAAEAVDHFETTLGIGPVKLEETPIGLRVYTERTEG